MDEYELLELVSKRGNRIQNDSYTLTVHYDTGKCTISPYFLRLERELDTMWVSSMNGTNRVVNGVIYYYSNIQGVEFENGYPVFREKDLEVLDRPIIKVE